MPVTGNLALLPITDSSNSGILKFRANGSKRHAMERWTNDFVTRRDQKSTLIPVDICHCDQSFWPWLLAHRTAASNFTRSE